MASGAPRHEMSAMPAAEINGEERWMSHGSSAMALAWVMHAPTREEPTASPRPSLVALLCIFIIQLIAPKEPALPLVAGSVVGLVISKNTDIDAALASPYWTLTSIAWLAFFAGASFKATRPNRTVPGFSYSHLPNVYPRRPSSGDLEEPEEDTDPGIGPDGAPIFRVLDPSRYSFDASVSRVAVQSSPNSSSNNNSHYVNPQFPVEWPAEPLVFDPDDDHLFPERLYAPTDGGGRGTRLRTQESNAQWQDSHDIIWPP